MADRSTSAPGRPTSSRGDTRFVAHTRRQRRPLAHVAARIRLQMARAYLADLRHYRAGDDGRFTRMVDGRGRQLGDAATWLSYIRNALADANARHFHPGVVRRIERELQQMGYGVGLSAADD